MSKVEEFGRQQNVWRKRSEWNGATVTSFWSKFGTGLTPIPVRKAKREAAIPLNKLMTEVGNGKLNEEHATTICNLVVCFWVTKYKRGKDEYHKQGPRDINSSNLSSKSLAKAS